jgi:hypothetical protein
MDTCVVPSLGTAGTPVAGTRGGATLSITRGRGVRADGTLLALAMAARAAAP